MSRRSERSRLARRRCPVALSRLATLCGHMSTSERLRKARSTLLDRLFDELTSGKVSDEKTQADRILAAKPPRTTPAEFEAAERAGAIKVVPFRLPGVTVLNPAPIRATLAGNDRVRVKLLATTFGVTEFKKETKTLPIEVALSGLLLSSDEVVGVRFYDLGGEVQFMKALRLVELSNQNDQEHLEKFIEVSAVAATLGAGSPAWRSNRRACSRLARRLPALARSDRPHPAARSTRTRKRPPRRSNRLRRNPCWRWRTSPRSATGLTGSSWTSSLILSRARVGRSTSPRTLRPQRVSPRWYCLRSGA